MATPRIKYADKRVLLVDSSGNMRSTIFYMLRELGVQNLRAVTITERVLELIRDEAFDIILLGHNSSDAVTGMQLLEEARYRGYIRPTAGWLFMTSDASQAVVLHAIDSRPDGLITKPFSIEELKQRLDQLIRRKQTLLRVEQAIEAGDLDAAVAQCDAIERGDACYEQALRLKAQCLIDLGRAQDAYQVVERQYWQSSDKDTGLLMAQALERMGRLAEAEELLEGLIEHYPLLIAAYDLLARVQEREGKLDLARDTLREATAKSPLGLPRQLELGRVAVQTDALALAETAYKRSIVLGRTSCYRSPEPYLRLANIRRLEMRDADARKQIALRNELDSLLNSAEFTFAKDSALKVRTALLRSQVCLDLGDEDEAGRLYREAENRNQALEQPLNLEREALGLAGDKVPLIEPEATPDMAATRPQSADPALAAKVNRMGSKHYMAGKLGQALRYFGMAVEYDPRYGAALLNLAQLYLEAARDRSERREERFKMADRYLRLAQRLELSEPERARLALLIGLRKKALAQWPEGALGVPLR